MSWIRVVVGVVWGGLVFGWHSTLLAEFSIVEDGRATATIVVADEPSEQSKQAAEQLQHYLGKMSGAKLEIVSVSRASQGNRILVGPSQAVAELGIEVPTGITYQMKEEGFVTKTQGDNLVLAGNETGHYRGTIYAVYDFLDELGCRWFFPGDYGEVVPRRKTISVDERDRVEQPDFRFRSIWMAGNTPIYKEGLAEMPDWYDRNKIGQLSMSLPGDGSVSSLAPADKFFESHPHIFALKKDGTRSHEMMCMSEDDSVRIAVETIDKYFQNNPDKFTYGFAPPDGFPTCYCKKCQSHFPGFIGKGYGDPSTSEVWFQFANRIATEVYKKHPQRWVLTNGYSNRVRVPEGVGPLSPNLGIQSAVIAACVLHPIGDEHCWQRRLYKQILDRWTEELNCVFIYDYEPGISLANLPSPTLHNLANDIRYYKDRGVWGFWTESGYAWMITHLNNYVRGKLMWDVEEDVRELVCDYCEKFYEEAADPIEDYMWTLEEAVEETHLHETWGRLMRWEVILENDMDELDALMAKAERRANSEQVKERLHMLRLTHDHMKAYIAMEEAVVDGDFAEGVRWGKRMIDLRDQAAEIKPGMLPHTPEFRKNFRSSIEWHIDQYQALADLAGGEKGELIAMLPRQWKFKKDPHDIGIIYQWYEEEPDGDWEPIDTTIYWEAQGHVDDNDWGYAGKAWYQTDFSVPEDKIGKPLWLTIGAVYNRGVWIWVNGQMVKFDMERHHRLGHHDVREPIHLDITKLARPGKNKVAVLVHTNQPGRNPRGGIHRRTFLWSPK